jgi:ATP-dependent exoDNAse (exonuclease V) beta subunit
LLAALNGMLAPALGVEVDKSRPWVEPFSPLEAHRQVARPGFEAPYVELHLTVGAKREGALERAAEMVVGRLVALVEGEAGDPEDGVGESPDYGDIAILCRASAAFRVYEDALDRAGVPFLTVAGRGFYQRPEIRDLLNALRALSDPTDDLALVGLLRSSAIGLSDVTLYSLCRGRDRSLWEIIREGKERLGKDPAWRIERAVRIIRELHQRVGRIPVSHLLKGFLDRTDYRAALIRAGDTRSARNVSKLLSDAQQSGIVSTSEFLEYIDRLRESGTREGEARAAAKGAVQIMSIHAAKGLEFPVVVIGDVTGSGGGSAPLLIDPELGVVLPLSEGGETAAVYRLAKSRSDDQEATEANRLLYVAATRAQEKLILNGSVTRRQDGSLGRFGPWLAAFSRVEGVELAEMEVAYDEEGREAHRFDWLVAGQQVRCVIYEPGHEGMRRKAKPISAAEEPSAWPPKLLGPVIPKGRSFDETVWDRERPLRRVVPDERETVTPRVVGLLVHEALAAWQFPGSGFHDLVKARAHRYGIRDSRQLRATVDRVTELMKRLRDHALYDEMAGAERRLHEVPYVLMTNGEVESGAIDLLYRRSGRWTAVEFKTSRVSARGGAWAAMDDGALRSQVERYRGALETLLGEVPRFLVCLLDVGGRVEVVPV